MSFYGCIHYYTYKLYGKYKWKEKVKFYINVKLAEDKDRKKKYNLSSPLWCEIGELLKNWIFWTNYVSEVSFYSLYL